MVRRALFVVLMLTGVFVDGVSQEPVDSLLGQIPELGEIAGLVMSDSSHLYKGADLYRFIDGGADLFLEYGFRQVVAVEYQKEETFNLEIYEMTDAAAAYGIYSVRSGSDADPRAIGDEGSSHGYYIMFWKGRYYVSVAASDSTLYAQRILEQIARAVERKIPDHGDRPYISDLLPRAELLKVRYFRGFLGLSIIYQFGATDILRAAEGVAGTYRDHMLILLRYQGSEMARIQYAAVKNTLKSNGSYRQLGHEDSELIAVEWREQSSFFMNAGSFIVVSIASNSAKGRAACEEGARLVKDQ